MSVHLPSLAAFAMSRPQPRERGGQAQEQQHCLLHFWLPRIQLSGQPLPKAAPLPQLDHQLPPLPRLHGTMAPLAPSSQAPGLRACDTGSQRGGHLCCDGGVARPKKPPPSPTLQGPVALAFMQPHSTCLLRIKKLLCLSAQQPA